MNRTNTAALSDPATWGNHSAQLEQVRAGGCCTVCV